MDPQNLLGHALAGFELTQFLGQGGMALVFRGENLVDRSILRAIKIVRPEFAGQREFGVRFAEEARLLERLSHPNVVRFYGVRSEQGYLMMELELLEGKPLSALLLGGSQGFSMSQVIDWFTQAAEGLSAAHALGFVHRDLKPDNLFLTRAGIVKVLDFGIARARDDAQRATKATSIGTTPGTAAYIAPEVWRGGTPAAAADVYALGISMCEVLLGHHPFCPPGEEEQSSPQLMFKHLQTQIPRLSQYNREVPEMLEEVLSRATAKDPSERYPDAAELAAALRSVLLRLPGGQSVRAAQAATPGTQFALPQFSAPTPAGALRPTPPRPERSATPSAHEVASPAPARAASGAAWLALPIALLLGAGAYALHARGKSAHGAETEAATAAASASAPASASAAPAAPVLNAWITVTPAASPVPLGVDAGVSESGFKPSRKVTSPRYVYQLQQHEVTFQELEPWIATRTDASIEPPDYISEFADERRHLPVTGIGWTDALAYCKSLGGSLPTEEEWEFAARSEDRRQFAWGEEGLDLERTNAFGGKEARLRRVMTSDQDVTPGPSVSAFYDLMGNAEEWTLDLFREDEPSSDESWVQEGGHSFRALRGLPLTAELPRQLPRQGAAFRRAMCATGSCPPEAKKLIQSVGFRCARKAQ